MDEGQALYADMDSSCGIASVLDYEALACKSTKKMDMIYNYNLSTGRTSAGEVFSSDVMLEGDRVKCEVSSVPLESGALNADYLDQRESILEYGLGHSRYKEMSENGFSMGYKEASSNYSGDFLGEEETKINENTQAADNRGFDDCDDNEYEEESEKDEDRMDEDDDDLTKKLLSIQVLPRIPKIKRTAVSGSSISSESSVPQRSVLERAEITTKSSSYPKWPKNSGSLANDKPRWRNDNKGQETNRGERPKKSSASMSERSNGHMFNRPSDTNFKRPLDFGKQKSFNTKRVPCEMLFDAVMAKENPQAVSSLEKDSNDSNPTLTVSLSCSSALQTGIDIKTSAPKQLSDDKNRLSDGKHQPTSRSRNVVNQLQNNADLEKCRLKASACNQNSSMKVNQCKPPDFQSLDKSCSDSLNSSEKQTTSSGFLELPQNTNSFESSVPRNSYLEDGSLTNAKLCSASQDCTSLSNNLNIANSQQFIPPLLGKGSLIPASDDAGFKRPSIQRVPRSRNRGHEFSQNSSIDNSVKPMEVFPRKHLDKIAGSKSVPDENSKFPLSFEEQPIEWTMEDGAEPPKSMKNQVMHPPSLASQSFLDSSMEVIDMDVVASPLCDDNLLSSEPVTMTTSGTSSATKKVVTFDCPDDVGRDSSKKQKASKRDKEVQRTLFQTKCDIQQQVVSEMKELLRPLYSKRKINKEEYKEIMRQAVPKICHNRKTQVAQSRIKKYADRYTNRVLNSRKCPSKKTENGKNDSIPTTSTT